MSTSYSGDGVIDRTGGIDILGTNTNDAAATGYVGEYVESLVNAVSLPATTTWGDLASLTSAQLTAGDWDVTGIAQFGRIAGTVTSVSLGISYTSGNSTAGLTGGQNSCNSQTGPTATTNTSLCVANYRVSISTPTTLYLKFSGVFDSTAPQANGRISARRVR